MLDDSGTHILWARELSSTALHEIKEMEFTPDSSKLVILLTNVMVKLFIHEALKGTLLTGLADSSSQLMQTVGTFSISNSALYFIGLKTTSELVIGLLDLTTPTYSFSFL